MAAAAASSTSFLRASTALWTGALLLLLAASPPLAQAQPAGSDDSAERPNIVFIFSDDHAVQALGAYDRRLAAFNPTPNLDRLAQQGMLFKNAFVTNSICVPSRGAILTGQFGHKTGLKTNGSRIDPGQTTFPKRLKEAGYQTAIVGKWHLKADPNGFDYWEVLPGQGAYYNPSFRMSGDTTRYTGYTSEVITDRALRWLEEGRDADQPFMLMYQHKAPHRNWMPGPDHLNTYDDVQIPAPKSLFYDYSGLSTPAVVQDMEISTDMRWGWDLKLPLRPGARGDTARGYPNFIERFTPEQRRMWKEAYRPENEQFYQQYRTARMQGRDLTRWKYQRYIKDYLRTIRSMDAQVGRLLGYLEENGLAENTIVVYSSDQGFFLGENGWFEKRWVYEESQRTPLIFRGPGVTEPGAESEAMVQNLDFAQTFLDVAGVDAPAQMQGRSLAPLMRGEESSEDWREALYYHYYEGGYEGGVHNVARHEGVRTNRYKLIHFYTLDQWELFDLNEDPDELHNVYNDPDYADVRKRMKERLDVLRDKYELPPQEGERASSDVSASGQ
jgi:arylsulfatase A-like enzyme